jgi:hypothetical protein
MTEQIEGIDEFNKELKVLLDKYGFVIGAEPFIGNGLVSARPTVAVKPEETEDVSKADDKKNAKKAE